MSDYFNEDGDLIWEASPIDDEIYLAMLELGWIVPDTKKGAT